MRSRKSDNSVVIPVESSSIPVESRAIPQELRRFQSPEWYEFEAATPVNQRYKALRVCGFLLCVSGAVAVMCMSRPPTEQILAILSCVLYVLVCDPFAAIGAILARASRAILASAVCLMGVTVYIPSPGLAGACILWTMTATAVVRRFNRRYLMQDTFASARAIPDAIRTAPESKAGLAWRHGGAKMVNAMAAEIGATCRNDAEVKARELAYYIGYQTADTKMTELARKCERLRLENAMYKDAEGERNELLRRIDEIEAENKKRLKTANTERQQLIRKIRELESTNAELLKAVPEEAPEDDAGTVEAKLDHAFKELHMTDKDAAEYAGCSQKKAWKYRKDNGIEPRGGAST